MPRAPRRPLTKNAGCRRAASVFCFAVLYGGEPSVQTVGSIQGQNTTILNFHKDMISYAQKYVKYT